MKIVQELLYSAGLVRVSPEIVNSALPSIRLRAHTVDEIQLEPGVTKFGGAPDLPQGSLWPEHRGSPLPFIAQICLTDLIPYDTAHLLPADGRLYFFFDVDAFFETRSYDPTSWYVWYDRSPFTVLQRMATPEALSRRRRYCSCTVTYALELTLPDYSQYDSASMQRLGLSQPLTDEEEQAYYVVQAQLAGRAETTYHMPIHRLLGHPDAVQWDMHRDLKGAPTDWLLLLQVDSDEAPNTNWGDTGRIYYWIRRQDLVAGDFSQTRLILQST